VTRTAKPLVISYFLNECRVSRMDMDSKYVWTSMLREAHYLNHSDGDVYSFDIASIIFHGFDRLSGGELRERGSEFARMSGTHSTDRLRTIFLSFWASVLS
jgi:hypothetical protein